MKKLLLHLDTDPIPSSFDAVVAYDSGADNLMSYGGVTRENVTGLVHGLMFTRGGNKLKNSAIFIGGSNVDATEIIGKVVKKAFFGPVRVSVMLDPNGSNTTAAAVVRKVMTNYDIKGKKVVIVGSGPVGQRAALYFVKEGAGEVVITSRDLTRAKVIVGQMKAIYDVAVTPAQAATDDELKQLLQHAHVSVGTGPAGICVLPKKTWESSKTLEILADVNAVPPLGVEKMDIMDNGTEKDGVRFYGAIAIGNFKMKVHHAAVAALFESNDVFLDETTIYDIARAIDVGKG